MKAVRAVVLGNAGAGKTTLLGRMWPGRSIRHLTLDDVAWEDTSPPKRRPDELAFADIDRFVEPGSDWVVEGCYGTLISYAATHADQMYFLNIGIDACVANCRARPWEADKYPSKEAQDEYLDTLIAWVKEYEAREDDCSLAAHRDLFDTFAGEKHEITSNKQNTEGRGGNR